MKDSYSSDQMVGFSSYVLNKYKLSFDSLKIKYKDLEEVQEKILKADPNLKINKFAMNMFYDFHVMESDENFLTFDSYENKKKIQINYYFNDYSKANEIFEIVQSFQDKDDEIFVNISNFFLTPDKSVKANEMIKVKDDFSINSENYYPYIDTNEMFSQFMMSDSNILLLSGEPGTGKTRLGDTLMQYLLEKADITEVKKKRTIQEQIEDTLIEVDVMTQESSGVKVAYIKNEEILSMDSFWNILQEEEYHLIFLDDLDFSLLPRTQNISTSEDIQKNKFISNLLSFTDGIFNAGNKTKFVITSNRDVTEIDTAVLRKGRTFDILNLRQLKHEEAGKIWVNSGLEMEDFNEEFQDEKVLQADLGSTITLKLRAKAENKEIKPYITEEGISVYNKIKHPKRVGL
jgi:DNA replication protein DnaC